MSTLISLEDVTVLRAGRAVLDGISLKVSACERVALAGPNGAGKTTVLRTLVGLETPASGTVSAFGLACRCEKDFRAARRKVAYLFQDPEDQLFCATVLDDVMFGPINLGLSEAAAAAKARATLDLLDLAPLAGRITHRLSGGEKRLVALASVLAMDPLVLLLDEPTNGLDEAHFAHLMRILSSLPTAMLIVSHDWQFLAQLATRAVLLRQGRLSDAIFHRHPHAHDHVHIHALERSTSPTEQ
jgi:cobalt/nickel transport system ATP-binding protein